MGFRGIAVLLALLAAAGVALWLSDEKPKSEPALTDAVLDGRSIADAHRLAVVGQRGAMPIEFERPAGVGAWRVTEPVRDLASAAVLEAIRVAYDPAQMLVGYEPADVTDVLLRDTGLAAPEATVQVEWADGERIGLAIGAPGPYGDDRFARRTEDGASGRIYRVQTALLNALQFTPDDAREKAVFVTEPQQVTSVRVDRRIGDGDVARRDALRLVRRGMSWVMEEPAALRVDPRQCEDFVRALLGLRIDGFLIGRPEPGLSPIDVEREPDVQIDVAGALGAERVKLYFAAERVALVGHNDVRDVWFQCQTRSYDQIVELPIRVLRAKWLFTAPVDELRVVRVLAGDGGVALELTRNAGQPFRMVQPIAREASATGVNELLQALRSLVVREFVADDVSDFTPYGLDERALVVEVEVQPGRPERILVGADTGADTTWLRRADERNVVTIPRAVAERLRRPWDVYVDRQVLRITDGALVRRIVRELPDGARVELVRGDDGKWRRDGTGEPLPRVADLFDVLRDLTAKDVLPDGDATAGAVERGALELFSASGQGAGRIALSQLADGTVLARVSDAPGVAFVLGARDGGDLVELR